MPDERDARCQRCQMPEMPETVWKPQTNNPWVFLNSRKIRQNGRKFSHSAVSVGKNIFPKQIKDSPLNFFYLFSEICIWDLGVRFGYSLLGYYNTGLVKGDEFSCCIFLIVKRKAFSSSNETLIFDEQLCTVCSIWILYFIPDQAQLTVHYIPPTASGDHISSSSFTVFWNNSYEQMFPEV